MYKLYKIVVASWAYVMLPQIAANALIMAS